MLSTKRAVAVALVVLIAALLVVGAVGGTPIRHALQVAPGVLLLAVGARRSWFPCAAAAVFVFWLFCMSLIWLFLLGIARVVTGHFTKVEIALTLVIGLASIAGLVAACRVRPLPGWPARIALFVVAAAVQFGATWLSLQPSFANR